MRIFKYTINMNRVSFSTRVVLCLLIFSFWALPATVSAKKQSFVVAGIVRDAHTKKPVIAAQVTLLNAKQVATTDEKGFFKIEIPSKNALLTVSAFDYGQREVAVQGADSVVVNLYPEAFSTYSKRINGLTGEAANSQLTVSAKGINELNQSKFFTVDEALQSELSGDVRSVSRSALTGEGMTVFIRGLNSLNANAQPLYVVDDIIWSNAYDVTSIHQGYYANPLSSIDINDIASVSVLKDGTAIYGSKASNGVVLITTKRGAGMATKINLSIVSGVTTTPKSTPVMNANEYKVYVTDMLAGAGFTNNEIAQLPYLNDDPRRTTYNQYHNNTDWKNEVYRTALSKSYAINVNGGDEKALYYFSLGYTGNDGVVKQTDFQRYNMRLNGDIKLLQNFKLGFNVGFSRIDQRLVDDGVNDYSSPTWISMIKSPLISPTTFTFAGERTNEFSTTDIFNIGNPGAIIEKSNNTVKRNFFNVTLKPELSLTKNLKLTEEFDFNANKTNEDYYRPFSYAAPIFIQGIGYSTNTRESQVIRNNTISNNLKMAYNYSIDELSHVNLLVGTRYFVNNLESDYVEGHNSGSNTAINLLGSFTHLYTSGLNNYNRTISNYLSLDYNYDNRYLLNVAGSMDASSRFGTETKSGLSLFGHDWGVFRSANAAWLVTSEKFMKYVPLVSQLKIRAGAGVTGNDDIKDYQSQTYFSAVRFKGVANGIVLSSLANPTIQWETTTRYNLGVDMGLFNDRLTLTADVYSSTTDNLLVLKDFQDVAGLKSYWTNEGSLSNKGIELSVNAKLVNLKQFGWELGLSAGHYINKITSLPNGSYITDVYGGQVITQVGSAAGLFYGYKTKGVFANDAAASAANLKIQNVNGTYSYFGAGDINFEDVPNATTGLKDGIIDESDKQVIGNPNPKVYGSIVNKFTFGKLTLSTLFTYSYGNDVYNYQRSQLESGLDFRNQSTIMLTRWTAANEVTSQPRAVYGDPMGNSRFSDRWIEDGSYLRLKTVTLSYTFPIKSNFLEGVDLWFSANNLVTFTKYLGADPEFSTQNSVLFQGVDAGLLPLSKSYNVGLRFNL